MEELKIMFFALGSFFGMEDGRIAAEKTTVTVNPLHREVTIIQENLFAVIQLESDAQKVLEQWQKFNNWNEKETPWSVELDSFSEKSFFFSQDKKSMEPHLVLRYSSEKELQALGIWYNKEKNQFSINQIPEENIKTKEGNLDGNYWVFDGDSTFSFTVEPFPQMPAPHQIYKQTLESILEEN
jgi:hypothetical protein